MGRLDLLKSLSGSHSPSIAQLARTFPQTNIHVDACFIVNPYATDLFLEWFNRELRDQDALYQMLRCYPSQNRELTTVVADRIGVPDDWIFLGNGTSEIIFAVLQFFSGKKLLVNLPTFSAYYECAPPAVDTVFYNLKKANEYRLDCAQWLDFVHTTKPDSVVLINPNNPDGGYLPLLEMTALLEQLQAVPTVIIDESFLPLAGPAKIDPHELSVAHLLARFDNVIIIKSQSKDMGVPGVRVGYALLRPDRVKQLNTAFLWNISGLAEFFFRLYARADFYGAYLLTRDVYLTETQRFFAKLTSIPKLKCYASNANFMLVELAAGFSAQHVTEQLLFEFGVYVRDCGDKKGLEGEFMRIAAGKTEENDLVYTALRTILG